MLDLVRRRSELGVSESRESFLDGDRQKLLAVIEAGFGAFAPFNKMVREIFQAKMDEAAVKSHEAAIRWRSRTRKKLVQQQAPGVTLTAVAARPSARAEATATTTEEHL